MDSNDVCQHTFIVFVTTKHVLKMLACASFYTQLLTCFLYFSAVVLNAFVIYAVVKFGRYRASIDIFLTNLAASDIIHAGIVTPVHFRNVTAYDHNFNGGKLYKHHV